MTFSILAKCCYYGYFCYLFQKEINVIGWLSGKVHFMLIVQTIMLTSSDGWPESDTEAFDLYHHLLVYNNLKM